MDIKSKQQNFLLQSFAHRLCTVLKEKGHTSNTASSGVKVGALSQAANCSHQMARRYTLGEAMPDYNAIVRIANWLEISPGWLLFGDDEQQIPTASPNTELVGINYPLLRYILLEAAPLLTTTEDTEAVVNFIMDMIYDAAHLPTNDKTTKKIIDMAISSAGRFQHSINSKKDKEPHRGIHKETLASA